MEQESAKGGQTFSVMSITCQDPQPQEAGIHTSMPREASAPVLNTHPKGTLAMWVVTSVRRKAHHEAL